MARLEGFEPTTLGSEDRCSGPLSYRRKLNQKTSDFSEILNQVWGERRDSNPRSPGPQPGALNRSATLTTSHSQSL